MNNHSEDDDFNPTMNLKPNPDDNYNDPIFDNLNNITIEIQSTGNITPTTPRGGKISRPTRIPSSNNLKALLGSNSKERTVSPQKKSTTFVHVSERLTNLTVALKAAQKELLERRDRIDPSTDIWWDKRDGKSKRISVYRKSFDHVESRFMDPTQAFIQSKLILLMMPYYLLIQVSAGNRPKAPESLEKPMKVSVYPVKAEELPKPNIKYPFLDSLKSRLFEPTENYLAGVVQIPLYQLQTLPINVIDDPLVTHTMLTFNRVGVRTKVPEQTEKPIVVSATPTRDLNPYQNQPHYSTHANITSTRIMEPTEAYLSGNLHCYLLL
jgi:hypothetical protein